MLELAIACAVSAAAWTYLVLAHGGYWMTGQRLPAGDAGGPGRGPARWPGVAAVVPARNEADMLPVALPALLGQEYPGEFRVILVDDRSDDGTGEIAAKLGEAAARDGGVPLTVVAGRPRPEGWAGKVWAMAQGVAVATAGTATAGTATAGTATAGTATAGTAGDGAGPGYLLFTDADIAWAPGALHDLVAAAERDDRAAVSQMALLRAETAWERLIVPAFVYFFAQLYPFRRVNHPARRTAAAAGGCMLVRTAALAQAGGLDRIRGALIDDVALGALLKSHGNRTWLGLTTHVRSARPYPGLASLWQMIARSAYVQLRYNPALLAGTIAGLLLLYAAPPLGAIAWLVTVLAGHSGAAIAAAGLAGLLGWALMAVSYVPLLRLYRLSPLRAPGLPAVAMLYAAMTADSARRHYSGRAVSWRGRAAERA